MSKIIKAFSKMVIPFTYQEFTFPTFENKDKAKSIFIENQFTLNHLLESVHLKLGNGLPSIGKSYKLASEARLKMNLPKNTNGKIELITRTKDEKNFIITIENVYIHLFETKVGFIEFEFLYETDQYQDILTINYFLSEIKSKNNKIRFRVNKSKTEYDEVTTSIQGICGLILQYGIDVRYFKATNDGADFDFKPMLFSYMLFSEKPDNIERILELGANIYKESYKNTQQTINYLQPFENSYWHITFNGAMNVSHLIDDSTTNDFFTNTFYFNLQQQYFYLFLLALHQRFSMIHQIVEMNDISSSVLCDNAMILLAKEHVDQHIEKMAFFEARAYFTNVSSITQISDYFSRMQQCFLIKELYIELNQKIDSMKLLSDKYFNLYQLNIQKQAEAKMKKDEIHKMRIQVFVNLITQVIGGLTIFKLIWDVSSIISGGTLKQEFGILIAGILSLLFVFVLCWKLIEPLKTIKLLKKGEKANGSSD